MSEAVQLNAEMMDMLDNEADMATNSLKFLSFTVNNEVYAFSALDIKEIIEYTNITKIPMVPPYIRGVTNLRGSVVPVIDLAARMGKFSAAIGKRTCIIILEVDFEEEIIELGVVIDAINEVFNIYDEDIEPSPSFGAGIRADFISGMGKLNGNFITLLNVERVLSINELSSLKDYSDVPSQSAVRSDSIENGDKSNHQEDTN